MLSNQDAITAEQQKRCNGAQMFAELILRSAGVACKVMKGIASSCSRETAKLCTFVTDEKKALGFPK